MGTPQSEVESALTEGYQHAFRANGEVVLRRVSPDLIKEDPALAPFLALLERDIAAHPERLQPIGADLVRRLQDLVAAIEVDLDEALPDDDTLLMASV